LDILVTSKIHTKKEKRVKQLFLKKISQKIKKEAPLGAPLFGLII